MSNSGVNSLSVDQLSVSYDISVGEDQDSGTDGQVLISGGEGEPCRWEHHSEGNGVVISRQGHTLNNIDYDVPFIVGGNLPTTTTGSMGAIPGLGLVDIKAVSTEYYIECSFQITRIGTSTTSANNTRPYIRLDKSTTDTTAGWTSANGVFSPYLMAHSLTPAETSAGATNAGNRCLGMGDQLVSPPYQPRAHFVGKLTYNWFITGLTVGCCYNFIPRFATFVLSTANLQANTTRIQMGGGSAQGGAMAFVKATPVMRTSAHTDPAVEESEDDDY